MICHLIILSDTCLSVSFLELGPPNLPVFPPVTVIHQLQTFSFTQKNADVSKVFTLPLGVNVPVYTCVSMSALVLQVWCVYSVYVLWSSHSKIDLPLKINSSLEKLLRSQVYVSGTRLPEHEFQLQHLLFRYDNLGQVVLLLCLCFLINIVILNNFYFMSFLGESNKITYVKLIKLCLAYFIHTKSYHRGYQQHHFP